MVTPLSSMLSVVRAKLWGTVNHERLGGESRPGQSADYDRYLTTCHEQELAMAKKSRKKKARKKSPANHGKRPNS
jgi:hypothetical protein